MDYVTLTQVRAYRNLKTGETTDDDKLRAFIRGASRFVDGYCRRHFDVRRETRLLDYPIPARSAFGVYSVEAWVTAMNATADIGAGALRVDDDLLSVETLLNGDGSTIASSAYVLEPANVSVHHTIRLTLDAGVMWLPGASGRREQVISVTGLWGYHPDYARDAWIDSLDTIGNDPLSAVGTSVTVTNALGADETLQAPRFQAGQMLKLDNEFVSVTAVNGASNVLTIKRAVNGSIAASHAKSAAIYTYRPPESIVQAVLRLVAWRYTQKDANSFDRETILGTGIAITPSAVPADVIALLPAPKPPRLT